MNTQTCTGDGEKATIVSPHTKKHSKLVIHSSEPRATTSDLSRVKDICINDASSDSCQEEYHVDDVHDFSDAEHDFEWECTQMKKGLPHKASNFLPTTTPNEHVRTVSEIEAELTLQITTLNQQLLACQVEIDKIPSLDHSSLSNLEFVHNYLQHASASPTDTSILEHFPPADILIAFESVGLNKEYLSVLSESPHQDTT